MMKDFEIDRVGRMMAGILRHFPERFGLTMDGRGWVDLDQFVEAVQDARPQWARWLRRQHIEALVETDDKGRYQIDGGMLRATYAHSVPVNLDDLPEANVDHLYFPVAEEELDIVLETGLRPSDRNMIHLSATPEKAYSAGRVHHTDPILLEIDVRKASQSGNFIFRAGRSVYVTDAVEPQFLSKVEDADLMAKLKIMGDEEAAAAKEKAEREEEEARERRAQREAREAEGGGRRDGRRGHGRDGGREGGRDGGRDGPREGGREGGPDGGRDGPDGGGDSDDGGRAGGRREGRGRDAPRDDDASDSPPKSNRDADDEDA